MLDRDRAEGHFKVTHKSQVAYPGGCASRNLLSWNACTEQPAETS